MDLQTLSAQRIEEIRDICAGKGLFWEESEDWEELRHHQTKLLGKPHLFPIFDPDFEAFTNEGGFWFRGTDRNGKIVHMQAVRMIDAKGGSVGDFIVNKPELFAVPGREIMLDQSKFAGPEICRQITGRMAYHGLIWLADEYKGGLAAILPRALVLSAWQRWHVDVLFGFVHDHLIYSGYASRSGYTLHYPGGIDWKLPDGSFAPYHFVWINSNSLHSIAGSSAQDVYDRAEEIRRK